MYTIIISLVINIITSMYILYIYILCVYINNYLCVCVCTCICMLYRHMNILCVYVLYQFNSAYIMYIQVSMTPPPLPTCTSVSCLVHACSVPLFVWCFSYYAKITGVNEYNVQDGCMLLNKCPTIYYLILQLLCCLPCRHKRSFVCCLLWCLGSDAGI